MPTPTPQQVIEQAHQSGGRIDSLLAEVMRLQSEVLNPTLQLLNADPAYDIALPLIKDFKLKGDIIEKKFPIMVIDGGVSSQPQGVRGHADYVNITLSILFKTPSDIVEKMNSYALAQWAWSVFNPICGAHKDPAGRPVWSQMQKLGITTEDAYPTFMGVRLTMQAEQFRGVDYWRIP